MVLQPPAERSYSSYGQAFNAVNEHAAKEGYAVSKLRSKIDRKEPPTIRKVWLRCDKSGTHTPKNLKRQTGSRKVDCPFQAIISRAEDDSWVVRIKEPNHNHEASRAPVSHPAHRKRSDDTVATIQRMVDAECSPRQILSTLLAQESITITSQDIYNEIKAHRKQKLGGLSPTQALLLALEEYGIDENGQSNPDREYYHEKKLGNDNKLSHLFFAHPASISLLKKYPDVLLLDCTYKTNKYKMPLLHICGVTNLGTTFSIGFAFLSAEREEDYSWAIGIL
jgi:hypothetical protein